MYVDCLIPFDKLVRTYMELILLHFLSFPNNFNVFYAISPAPLCREETPLQSFVFGESKHLKKSKSLTCSSTLDSCLPSVLLCMPATFWDQPATSRPGFVRAIKRQVCPHHQGQFIVLELLKVIPAHLKREDSWKEQDCTVWATSKGTRN